MTRSGWLFQAKRSCFLAAPGEPIVVGRRPPRTPRNVRVDSMAISRQHFAVTVTDVCTVEDTQSAGGTFVNEERMSRAVVAPGDRIKVNADLIYEVRPLSGESLGDRWQRGPVPLVPGLRIARAVLVALSGYEGRHCHGGLDPHQILLEADDRVTLLDNGWTAVGEDGKVTVDPYHCAPETYRKGEVTQASDVFVLACLLYEALAGRVPFPNDDVDQAMMAKEFGAPPEMRREWPNALSAFFSFALDNEPRRRWSPTRLLGKIDDALAEIDGQVSREPIAWLVQYEGRTVAVLTWRHGVELTVEILAAGMDGFASWARQRFLEFTGHRNSVEPDDVERFMTMLIPHEMPGLTARRAD